MIRNVVPRFGLTSTKQVDSSTGEKHNLDFGCFDSNGVNHWDSDSDMLQLYKVTLNCLEGATCRIIRNQILLIKNVLF
jgi:hypothetical protein